MHRAFWAAVAAALTTAGRAEAGVVIDIDQVGSVVVATGSGSLNLTGLTSLGTLDNQRSGVNPSPAGIDLGPSAGGTIDAYSGLTGPSSFGSGGSTFSSSGSGDLFGLDGAIGFLGVP